MGVGGRFGGRATGAVFVPGRHTDVRRPGARHVHMETASNQACSVGSAGAAMPSNSGRFCTLNGGRLRGFAKVLRKTATPLANARVIFHPRGRYRCVGIVPNGAAERCHLRSMPVPC